jgi:hypothetical protein
LNIIATVFYWAVLDSPGFIIGAQTEDRNANITIGQINNTQMDLNDNTTWLLTGKWKSNSFINTDFNNTNPVGSSGNTAMESV